MPDNLPSPISETEALELLELESKPEITALMQRANAVREQFSGRRISACSIINARCGGCSEDCAFCAQSRHSTAEVELYPLVDGERIVQAARDAAADGAQHFGIVTSGRAVNPGADLEIICNAIRRISTELNIAPCASLGILSREALKQLKDAGLTRYHHNLETAASFFPEICGTRKYEDQLATIRRAAEIGLSVCCGGIFGLGETNAQRVELLACIRKLDVNSVPLNFLVPIPGTRLAEQRQLSPEKCLKIIAVARLMLPDRNIRVCGGREYNLRDLQHLIFAAGADGLMIGGYLVTSGREVAIDKQMISDAGMKLNTPPR